MLNKLYIPNNVLEMLQFCEASKSKKKKIVWIPPGFF